MIRKKRKYSFLLGCLLSLFAIAGCSGENPNGISGEEISYSAHYFVSFYVENTLYQTARVKEGETVTNIVEAPTKEDHDFTGWKTKEGVDFDLEATIVTASINVYASFTKKETPVVPPIGNDLNVEDVKDDTKSYYMVIGWYGKTTTSGLDVENTKVFYTNLISYLRSKAVSDDDINKISVRRYCTEEGDNKVADMGALINKDADCDILLGVGGNVDSTGEVAIKEKTGEIKVTDTISRYIARLTDTAIVAQTYQFIVDSNTAQNSMFDAAFEVSKTPSDDPIETELNVEDVKDDEKSYYMVIGWYGKTSTSGLSVDNMRIFYKNLITYLKAKSVSDDDIAKISVRRYCTEEGDNKVADMGALINKDADCDIILGVGVNVDTTGAVAVKEKTGDIIVTDTISRYIARITDTEMVMQAYQFIVDSNTAQNSMFSSTFELANTPVTTLSEERRGL